MSYVTHVRVDTPSALRASSRCGRVKPMWAACVGRRSRGDWWRLRHRILTVPYHSSVEGFASPGVDAMPRVERILVPSHDGGITSPVDRTRR